MPCFVAICVWSFRIIKHWKGKKRTRSFREISFCVCMPFYICVFRKQKKIVSESSEDEWRRLVDWSSCGGGGRLIYILADSIMENFFCIFLQFQKHLFKMIFFKLQKKIKMNLWKYNFLFKKNSLCCRPNIRSFSESSYI